MTTPANGHAVPDIWYKGQRVLRSIVAALVVLLPILNSAAMVLASYLHEQTHVTLPPVVFIWLNGIVAVTAVIIGAASRVMAIPAVNAWLTRWLNLGSVPKDAIAVEEDVSTGTVATYVLPDPKAANDG